MEFPPNEKVLTNFIRQVEQDREEPPPGVGQRDPGLGLEADERPAQGALRQRRPPVPQCKRHRGQP